MDSKNICIQYMKIISKLHIVSELQHMIAYIHTYVAYILTLHFKIYT